MAGVQFVLGEITSARTQIRAGVAQHIDQLKRHSVTLSESQHFIFATAGEVANLPETESRPKFTDTTGNQIGVFVEIGSGGEGADFLRIIKALQVEHLAACDFFEHHTNVIAVGMLRPIEPGKAFRYGFQELPFARGFLKLNELSHKVADDIARSS